MKSADRSRVVITGMGLVGPLGAGVEVSWRRLLQGTSGVSTLPAALTAGMDVTVGGQVPSADVDAHGFDLNRTVPAKDQKKMDRFIQLALGAADEAAAQARLDTLTERQRERTATIIASGIGGFPLIADAVRRVAAQGPRRLSPFTAPGFLANLAAGWISIRHGLKGPLGAPATACAASVQAIGDGARMIRAGEVDVAVCGGAEACLDSVSLASFLAARALSTSFGSDPSAASRPFDTARDGFVMSEGAGVLVLESLANALERGATPLAEVVGYGTSADAFHLTASPDDGSGARRAMRAALDQAGVSPDAIGHINAHATSTFVGDRAELAAITSVFGNARPAVASTKSSTGHLLGAAGAVEAIFSALAIRDSVVPPTLNLTNPDPAAEHVNLVALRPLFADLEYVMSNGFGFGGVNASVVLRRYDAPRAHQRCTE